MAALKALRLLPPRAAAALLRPGLPLYRRVIRPRQAARLQALFSASPFPHLTVSGYYRMRLELLWRCLNMHGRDLVPGEARVEGIERYREALAGGKPVVLLGLHMGVVELLHRLPAAPAGRPFAVLTAPAFSPPLTHYMAAGRERDGKRILPNRDLGGLRNVLAGNGVLAMMIDQVPGSAGGRDSGVAALWDQVAVPYPGRLLEFLRGRGCAMMPVSTRMEGDGSCAYRFHAPWGDLSDTQEAVRGFLEEAIAWAPDQWNWSYPRIFAVPK